MASVLEVKAAVTKSMEISEEALAALAKVVEMLDEPIEMLTKALHGSNAPIAEEAQRLLMKARAEFDLPKAILQQAIRTAETYRSMA